MDCSPSGSSVHGDSPEYWTALPCSPPGDLPNSGIEPRSPALQADSLPSEPPGKPKNTGVGSLSLLQGIFPNPGIKPGSPALQADCLPAEPPGKPFPTVTSMLFLQTARHIPATGTLHWLFLLLQCSSPVCIYVAHTSAVLRSSLTGHLAGYHLCDTHSMPLRHSVLLSCFIFLHNTRHPLAHPVIPSCALLIVLNHWRQRFCLFPADSPVPGTVPGTWAFNK